MEIQGKRHDIENDANGDPQTDALEIGEYGKSPDGTWYCRPPAEGFDVSDLKDHTVFEIKGTITVQLAILVYGANGEYWHGYLTKGVWRGEVFSGGA